MVWSGVLLLMLHFVSDFEKVLSHKVHKESTRSPQGVHLESMWSLHGVHMESTGSPQGIWDSRWTPGGVHCNLWGSVTYRKYRCSCRGDGCGGGRLWMILVIEECEAMALMCCSWQACKCERALACACLMLPSWWQAWACLLPVIVHHCDECLCKFYHWHLYQRTPWICL